MDFHLLPQFCVYRPDGTLSPLLALDELPPYVQVLGLPRSMRQTVPNNMTRIATAYHPGRYYSVDAPALNAAGNPGAAAYGLGLKNGMASGGGNAGGSGGGNGNGGKNGSTRSGRKKKVYCSYWIRHGECDYAQQGKGLSMRISRTKRGAC